jgi:hypothetical protein
VNSWQACGLTDISAEFLWSTIHRFDQSSLQKPEVLIGLRFKIGSLSALRAALFLPVMLRSKALSAALADADIVGLLPLCHE